MHNHRKTSANPTSLMFFGDFYSNCQTKQFSLGTLHCSFLPTPPRPSLLLPIHSNQLISCQPQQGPAACHILVAGASGSPCGQRHFSELFHAILSSRKGYSRNLLRAEKNAAREQVITSLRWSHSIYSCIANLWQVHRISNKSLKCRVPI